MTEACVDHAALEKTPGTARRNVYLLVDCNNFFVSCERLFRPDLKRRPVLVMSNNDGCVIARSPEVKALGVPMGVAVFKIKDLVARHHIVCLSSNFNLYLNISMRVMRTLQERYPAVQIYSVDEAFVALGNVTDAEALTEGTRIRHTIAHDIGIPVGVGIATSKTLAKLANHHAKQHQGLCSLLDPAYAAQILRENPLAEIWGIGRRLNQHLLAEGLRTAWDLACADVAAFSRRYSITMGYTIRELRGEDCLREAPAGENQHQIMWSRTFRERLTTLPDLEEAICNYAAEAGHHLRTIARFCREVTVFINTSFYGEGPKYQNSLGLRLRLPTHDSRVLIEAAVHLLRRIFRPGYRYMRAGVILSDLTTDRSFQGSLLEDDPSAQDLARSDKLMAVMDLLRQKGHHNIYLASQGHLTRDRKYTDRRALTKNYTGSFADLPELY